MGIGGRMGVGASISTRALPTPAAGSDSGLPFPGVMDTAPTLVGGPTTGSPPPVLAQPATWIALGAAAYLVVVYLCFHHY